VAFEVSLTVHVPVAAALTAAVALGEDVGVAVVAAAVAAALVLGGVAAPPQAASTKLMLASGTAMRNK
jgi:hypothetical protein